jgi:hypothetical protein
LRPRNIKQERERLYDDALRQKMISNLLKDDNVKLKTRVQILETELSRKEKLIDELLMQQDNTGYNIAVVAAGVTKAAGQGAPKLKFESHLTSNLKKKIKELQSSVNSK